MSVDNPVCPLLFKKKKVAAYKYCDTTVSLKVLSSKSHQHFNLVLTENKQGPTELGLYLHSFL